MTACGCSSPPTRASSSAWRPNCTSSAATRSRSCRSRTGKCCRMTCSRRTLTSSRRACALSLACPRSPGASCCSPSTACARGCRPSATCRRAASTCSVARYWSSSRCAGGWPRPATRASARSPAPGNSRCAARCSTCSRWDRRRRCGSTCSIGTSIRFAASTRKHSARSRPSRSCGCCRPASCRSMPKRCGPSGDATASASRATSRACPSIAASVRASPRQASSSTCRCSSNARRPSPTTCRPPRCW